MLKFVLVLLVAFATPALARHHKVAVHHVVQKKPPCLKYLVMYAVDCPYIKGFCHGDFQMCDNTGAQ